MQGVDRDDGPYQAGERFQQVLAEDGADAMAQRRDQGKDSANGQPTPLTRGYGPFSSPWTA